MSGQSYFKKAMPGSLTDAVRQAHPRLPMDDTIARAVGNWVAHDQTTSQLAESRAEPHLHQYLEEAERIGRSHGQAACLVLLWPAVIVGFVVWILLVRG